jgi:glycerophosphoryl diester phosphodiesterase
MHRLQIVFLITILTSIAACTPTKTTTPSQTVLVAERGYGASSVQKLFDENTLEAVKNALKKVGGVEVDVQLSRSGTIWLTNDTQITLCTGKRHCIPDLTDEQIQSSKKCNPKLQNLTTLNNLLEYTMSTPIKEMLFIDVMNYFPESCVNCSQKKIQKYAGNIANKLIEEIGDYPEGASYSVLSSNKYVLDIIRFKALNISTYLVGNKEFARLTNEAITHEFTGVAYNGTTAAPTETECLTAQVNGLSLYCFNSSDSEALKNSKDCRPKFIAVNFSN